MEFRMLGPLEAWHDGAPVPLGDQQQRFVLVVLLLHANKPVTPARLAEIVWADREAKPTLVRSYIKRLRDVVGDATIETTPTGYLLRIGDDQLDTVRFDRLRAEAADVRADDPRRAIALLREAVGLWRGKFLEDIDIDRVGGPGVISPDESYPDAVGDLAELELEAGDHRSARDRLRPLVQADPASQKHAELLMRALLAGGDRAAALRVYHGTRDALAALRMAPGPVLRKLAARAEQGDPPSSLPSRPGGFTGRAGEIAVIEAAAAAGRRAVWVSGAPGVGKSGLAVEAAHRLRDRFPDGQLLARLNGFTPGVDATDVGDALSELLVELGVPAEQIPATVGRKVTLYQATLWGTRTLVVLDNAASPEQIRPLLPEADGCLAVITSRRMGDADTGDHIRLAPLPPAEAAELFHALGGPARLRGRAADVAAVVRRCGYLPMPIRVAAALFRRHDRWPLEHLLRLLDEKGQADANTAVRVSYQQLGEPQRVMFRLLGSLPGPDVDVVGGAALAGCDVAEARSLLDELHEVSLLEEAAPERYQMLDPLKEFAADAPAPRQAMIRLLDFYLVTLAAAVRAAYPFDRAQQPSTTDRSCAVTPGFAGADAGLRWIVAERDNLVAAIRYAAGHALPEHTWRLAVLLWRYFNTTNQFEDWIGTLELAWRTVAADQGNDYGQAHVLLRLATAHDRRGQLAEALELAARALPKWRRLGDPRGEAATLCALAIPTMELGRHDQAMAHLEAALAKYEQTEDRRGEAHALGMLGYLNELHGNLRTALRQHDSAARMLREIGHVQGLAHTLNNLGSVQERLGLLTEALTSYTEAHGHAAEVGDRCVEAYALNNIGNVHRQRGRYAEAVRYHDKAREVAANVPDADLRTQLYLDRGATALARGARQEALTAGKSALDLADGSGNRAYRARAHRGVAETLHAMGDHESAVTHWTAAEDEFAELELPEAGEVREERSALSCACAPR
ncbi:DNA-binding transcriptional activator of the SARP family [Amycolatopsis tolypomycina]|uniref:DNA-binding transcriptional activator of the SARP family n=1 Tax=Amycolatopsis tolypomycina TaxID=208445 RepID=A0A1H5CMN5_9PSEU|nr:tetratricopeptide repeat protein [Amycolatopsis tolypomycina]SED67708.1 DNA-binding transcriptional activator of the SARP family [Amycolatopsis tolypomycina]